MSSSAARLTLKDFLDEVRAEFFSLDRGFARTVWLMLTRPGPTLAEIWRGEQPTLTRPLRYFLISYSLYTVAYLATGAMELLAQDIDRTMTEGVSRVFAAQGWPPVTVEQIRAANPVSYYLASPLASELFSVVLLFVAAWIAFARWGINAAERLSTTLYLYSTFNLIQVPFVFLMFTEWRRAFYGAMSFVFVGYLTWAAAMLRPPIGWRSAWRGVAWWVMLQLLAALMTFALIVRLGWQVAELQHSAQAAPTPSTMAAPTKP